jgi:hypothetical protein
MNPPPSGDATHLDVLAERERRKREYHRQYYLKRMEDPERRAQYREYQRNLMNERRREERRKLQNYDRLLQVVQTMSLEQATA